jgi:hypothetical protein
MVEGASYALKMPGKEEYRRITLVSKGASRRGQVLVRLDDRGSGRSEIEVPSRRLKSDWRDYRVGVLEPVDTPAFENIVQLPVGGDVVERSDAPGFWIVRKLDLKAETVLVDGVLVGLRRREVIPIQHLRRATPPSRASESDVEEFLERHDLALRLPVPDRIRAASEWSPASEPTPEPREIAQRFLFGPRARAQYQWIVGNCPRGQEGRELAQEIATGGEIRWFDEGDSGHQIGEYIRYSVPGRFDIVLFDDPSGQDEVYVERIFVASRLRPRDNRHRRRRQGRRRRLEVAQARS